MPNIKPWCWPPDYTCDRVMYVPTRPANLLEYQEEFIDAQGNHYWKTQDSTALRGFASMKDLLEQMNDFYESKSCRRDKML